METSDRIVSQTKSERKEVISTRLVYVMLHRVDLLQVYSELFAYYTTIYEPNINSKLCL